MPQIAYKYDTEIGPGGKVELQVPLAEGTQVEVLVLAGSKDSYSDLIEAARSSIDFWTGPEDEHWNHV